MTARADEPVDAPTVTARIGAELHLMHERVLRLEAALSDPSVMAASASAPDLFDALQELDQLMQATRALADFCTEQGHPTPPDMSASLERVPLNDMASRLAGQPGTPRRTDRDELFG